MRKLVTVAALAAISGGTTMAAAADLGGMPPEPMSIPAPMLSNWSGFYVGLGVGGGEAFSKVKTRNETVTNGGAGLAPSSANQNFDLGGQGVLGTAQVGYDVQFPMSRWVAGVFGDFDWSSAHAKQNAYTVQSGSLTDPVTGVPYQPAGSLKMNFENEWTVGGRLGYLITPETYFYGLGGYSQGQASFRGTLPVTHIPSVGGTVSSPFASFSNTKTSDGWTAGLGLETHLKDNWFLKLEYRYTQYGNGTIFNSNSGLMDYTAGGQGCLAGNTCYVDYKNVGIDTNVQSARVVLTYKFNRHSSYDPLK